MKDEYIIKVKQVVGGNNATPPNQHVFLYVKGGRFAEVTGYLDSLPSNIELIDEADKTGLPGLVDMHVHLTREEPGADINLAPLYLARGVTSVRDVGSDLQAVKKMRLRIESGEIPGPRIFFCGPQLNGKVFRPGMSNLQTTEDARAKVKELHDEGAHALKIYDQLNPELARVVIKEARQFGLPVCGHLGKTTAVAAIGSGIGGVEHLTSLVFELFTEGQRNPFSQDVFRKIAEIDLSGPAARQICECVVSCGVYVDPTLVVYDRIARFPELRGSKRASQFLPQSLSDYWLNRMGQFTKSWSPDDFEVAKTSFDKLKEWLRFIQSEGAQVIAGTDTPNPYIVPGQSLLDEIKLLVEAGLSNRAAIEAATSIAASALNQKEEIGAIETGKRADFLLIRGDPIDDISSIENLAAVFKDGKRYDPETLMIKAAGLSRDAIA